MPIKLDAATTADIPALINLLEFFFLLSKIFPAIAQNSQKV